MVFALDTIREGLQRKIFRRSSAGNGRIVDRKERMSLPQFKFQILFYIDSCVVFKWNNLIFSLPFFYDISFSCLIALLRLSSVIEKW